MSGLQIWSRGTYWNIIIINIKRSWYQYYQHQSKKVLLIVKYNVWSPNMVAWNVELLHATVFFRVPLQLVVAPKLKKFNRLICFLINTCINIRTLQVREAPLRNCFFKEYFLNKGCHRFKKVQFFLTLFKRPLTPPPFYLNICPTFAGGVF